MAPLTVACVLRSGGDFLPEHVALLRDQVRSWLPAARFVCLSDVDVPCERIALQRRWRGFWAKIELFREFKERTLYFDLDTIIVGDPTPLTECGPFAAIRNWYKGTRIASGVMYWEGDYSRIYERFDYGCIRDYMKTIERFGDQAYIGEVLGDDICAFADGDVVSFKKHCEEGVPLSARVVAFHGKPRPWMVEKQWVRAIYDRKAA